MSWRSQALNGIKIRILSKVFCDCIKEKVAEDKKKSDAFWNPIIAEMMANKAKTKVDWITDDDPRHVPKDQQMLVDHENSVWEDVWPDYSELGSSVRDI
mgnify:CR=1 FL=1